MDYKRIFITGMLRSGTTFLEKLLGAHPDAAVLSQPLPFLLLEGKRRFHESIDYPEVYYILGTLFNEEKYSPADFAHFLENLELAPTEVRKVLKSMVSYSGQLTKFADIPAAERNLKTKDFYQIIFHLLEELAYKEDYSYLGMKETFAEEFLPFFINKGTKCILIYRDIRDIMTSLNYGAGQKYGGNHKPALFTIRSWRKSIAFALNFHDHPDFLAVKYEDMVSNQGTVLAQITTFLAIPPYPENAFEKGIPNQQGGMWRGNSSHGQIVSKRPPRKYEQFLPKPFQHYIEYCCYPELKALGYTTEVDYEEANFEKALQGFKEYFPVNDPHLVADYSTSDQNKKKELLRLKLLRADSSASTEEQALFIFQKAFQQLKSAL